MNNTKIDFLYLNEQDMLKAGVLNAGKCVDVMGEVMQLLSTGDYLMGGKSGNEHGICMNFPKESPFEDFPLNDAKDRRFMAMPAYLGGRFHIAGQKWYGSNGRNVGRGQPRSILMLTLNDVETGQPLAYMSANLLSAMRTGGMPGLAAELLAKPDTSVLSLIGPGNVNRACLLAFMAKFPQIKTIKIKGSSPRSKTAADMKKYIKKEFPHITDIQICGSTEEAVADADIISEACSVLPYHYENFEEKWLKPGSVFISSGTIGMSDEDMTNGFTKVVENIKMYEGYQKTWQTYDDDGNRNREGCVGLYFVNLRDDDSIGKDDIHTLGNMLLGKEPKRVSEDEKFLVGVGGMPILDVAWGLECYQNALKNGIGTTLNLWEEPYFK